MSRHVLGIFLFYFILFFFLFCFLYCTIGRLRNHLSSPLLSRDTDRDVFSTFHNIQVWTTRPCGHRPILRSIFFFIFFFTIIIIINVIIRIDRNTRRFDPETLLVWGHQHRRIIETDFLSATETTYIFPEKLRFFCYESSIS